MISFLNVFLISTMFLGFTAQAKMVEKAIEYTEGDTKLEGFLVYDDSKTADRPGVLVTHDWLGLTDKTKDRARMIAKLGYVAFAVDVYGQGIRPSNPGEAGKVAGSFKGNRALLRKRMTAGLEELKKQNFVDSKKLAAIGYCFGGTSVIELARAGAEIKGVVSFHGGLDSPAPADGKNIKAQVLALHGADDPYVPAAELAAFEEEMRSHKVDWQLKKYGGAVHSFTDQTLPPDNSKGAAYNAVADRRSWKDMQDFFAEIF